MSVIIQGSQLRSIGLGSYATKTTTITADTAYPIFTVAGGEVLVTALYGKVTTAITDAGEDVEVRVNPTLGANYTVGGNSGDIGTTDTPVGSLLTGEYDQAGTTDVPTVVVGAGQPFSFMCPTGDVELLVGAGSGAEDGVIEWYCTWVPLTDGATLVASA